MRTRETLVSLVTAWLTVGFSSAAQGPPSMVRVAVARVDVRTEATESGSPIGTVRYGEVLPLLGTVAGWDRVTVFVGASRVDGFVPASDVSPAPSSAAVNAALDIGSTPRVLGRSTGTVSVALDAAGTTQWIPAVETRAVPVTADPAAGLGTLGSSPAMAEALVGATPLPADPAASVTWTWLLAASAVMVRTTTRPTVTVIYNDVPDLPADQFLPVLIRLTPAESGWRLLTAARGRADAPFRDAADWDIKSSLVESAVAGAGIDGGNGLVKIRLTRALDPGEYAVVLRPVTTRPVAGTQVFSGAGLAAGGSIAYGEVWPFRVS